MQLSVRPELWVWGPQSASTIPREVCSHQTRRVSGLEPSHPTPLPGSATKASPGYGPQESSLQSGSGPQPGSALQAVTAVASQALLTETSHRSSVAPQSTLCLHTSGPLPKLLPLPQIPPLPAQLLLHLEQHEPSRVLRTSLPLPLVQNSSPAFRGQVGSTLSKETSLLSQNC